MSLTPSIANSHEVNPSSFAPTLASCPLESAGGIAKPMDESVKNARIFIVDDEPIICDMVRLHLRRSGFRNCETISKSEEAIDRILAELPDIVLLDIHMEPVSGWQILAALQSNDKSRHIPVLILSGASDEETRVKSLARGATDFLAKPVIPSELVARVRNTVSSKIYRDFMTAYSMQLEFDVLRDGLTGIANRRAFDYELKRRMIEWQRQRIPLSLLMIDIDHFKSLNDSFGHAMGDAALRGVGALLKSRMRDTDLVARYGGEEFAIVLPFTNPRDSKSAADRTRKAIEAHPFQIAGQEVKLTVSIGAADIMHGDDSELLIRRADAALYAAKRNGRNRCYYHDGAECQLILGEDSRMEQASRYLSVQRNPVGIDSLHIAVCDPDPAIIEHVHEQLQIAGFKSLSILPSVDTALRQLRSEGADLVLLDVEQPGGRELLTELKADGIFKKVPVVALTERSQTDRSSDWFQLGIHDYCQKPLRFEEFISRIRNGLIAKQHIDSQADYSTKLEHEIALRTAELAASRRDAIRCLARASELRDDTTGCHVLRVGRYAAIIARECGFSDERVVWLEHAAQLHDVGKISVPDNILMKTGPLTLEERRIMQNHCMRGSQIIRDESETKGATCNLAVTPEANFSSPLMKMAALVAESHHERWDGTGYPRGLKEEEIPIEGRITAVADVFDALSTERPYKAAVPLEQCFLIIAENSGSHFDPRVVEAFFRSKSEIVRVYQDYAEERTS